MGRTTERTTPLTEMNFRGFDLNSASASVTVYESDSGVVFMNAYTSGNATYTLPSVADCAGKMFMFYNAKTDYYFIIDLASGDTDKICCADSIVGDTVHSAAEVGEWCWVLSDGTYFYVLEGHGTMTVTEE